MWAKASEGRRAGGETGLCSGSTPISEAGD